MQYSNSNAFTFSYSPKEFQNAISENVTSINHIKYKSTEALLLFVWSCVTNGEMIIVDIVVTIAPRFLSVLWIGDNVKCTCNFHFSFFLMSLMFTQFSLRIINMIIWFVFRMFVRRLPFLTSFSNFEAETKTGHVLPVKCHTEWRYIAILSQNV